uniref:Uncharacterized protein n=1 Tax=Sphaerodactylus townsendi TaxID=933632 RepID=A0ACB8EC39_9SAUR
MKLGKSSKHCESRPSIIIFLYREESRADVQLLYLPKIWPLHQLLSAEYLFAREVVFHYASTHAEHTLQLCKPFLKAWSFEHFPILSPSLLCNHCTTFAFKLFPVWGILMFCNTYCKRE